MKILDDWLEFFFPTPRMCLLCHTRQDQLGVCEACHARYEEKRRRYGQCQRCGTFGVRAAVCDTCRNWPNYFTGNTALWPYQGEVRDAIVHFKFHHEPWRASAFAEQLLPYVEGNALLIPVPLHAKRLRERGYNQSALLVQALCRQGDLRSAPDTLVRTVNTVHQVGRTRSERMENMREAFAVSDPTVIQGQEVVLVDDILTTGATLLMCARTLHAAGAIRVRSITLAAGEK